MEVFLGHMLGMLPVLGVHAFEKAQRAAPFAIPPAMAAPVLAPFVPEVQVAPMALAPVELVCVGKAYEARGGDTAQGFVVFAGSTATADIGTSLSWGQRKLREDLLSTGVLQPDGSALRFTQDYAFSSPSTAASLIHGRSANGRIEWRAEDGRTLKALQEAEAAQ